MREWIQRLDDRSETILVLGVAFGWFVLTSSMFVFLADGQVVVDNEALFSIIVLEIALAAAIWFILTNRGWQPLDLFERFQVSDVLMALAIGLLSYFAYAAVFILAALIFSPDWVQTQWVRVESLALPMVLLIAIVNPIFEEALVVGFVFRSAEKWTTPITALNISVGLRLAYHLYQGPVGVLSIVPFGLVFGAAYLKWRRLWPLIIAHAFWDFIPLIVAG